MPAFFIKMLTDEGDMVLDIFGGSNTTGFAAEALYRKWLTFDLSRDYLVTSVFRFLEDRPIETVRRILSELVSDDANVVLEDVVCSLTNGSVGKVSRDDLTTTREGMRQTVLFEEKAQYKAKQNVGRRRCKPHA
jgi:site-specific DNA-methyltransferase (cytosine-N4-specific)